MGFFQGLFEHWNINHPDPQMQTTRDEVHQTLNQVQQNVSRARNLLDKENYRHSQSLEKAKQDLDSVAERIARAINS